MTKTLMGRLRLASVVIVALMALLSLGGLYALGRVVDGSDRVLAALRKLDRVQELRIALGRILVAPNDFLIFGDATQQRRFAHDAIELDQRYRDAEEVVGAQRLGATRQRITMLVAHGNAVFQIARPTGNPVGQGLIRRLDDLVQLTTHELDALLAESRADATATRAAAKRLEQDVEITVIVLSVLALAVAFFGVLFFARRVTRRLGRLHAAVVQLAAGDMATRVKVGRRDEIGEIGASFNKMVIDLDQARARVVEAERMAAIGQMTVTVKHELNNPISGIMMATELLARDPSHPLPEDVLETLAMIREGCEQLRAVVEQITSISEDTVTQYVGAVDMIDLGAGRDRR